MNFRNLQRVVSRRAIPLIAGLILCSCTRDDFVADEPASVRGLDRLIEFHERFEAFVEREFSEAFLSEETFHDTMRRLRRNLEFSQFSLGVAKKWNEQPPSVAGEPIQTISAEYLASGAGALLLSQAELFFDVSGISEGGFLVMGKGQYRLLDEPSKRDDFLGKLTDFWVEAHELYLDVTHRSGILGQNFGPWEDLADDEMGLALMFIESIPRDFHACLGLSTHELLARIEYRPDLNEILPEDLAAGMGGFEARLSDADPRQLGETEYVMQVSGLNGKDLLWYYFHNIPYLFHFIIRIEDIEELEPTYSCAYEFFYLYRFTLLGEIDWWRNKSR